MSIDKSYYVIAGCDLTGYKTDKYKDWKWTDDGEAYFCNKRKGRIQLFDDPMSGSYLYFGFILAAGDEYEFKTTKFDVVDYERAFEDVACGLDKLIHIGVIGRDPKHTTKYQIIVFEECT